VAFFVAFFGRNDSVLSTQSTRFKVLLKYGEFSGKRTKPEQRKSRDSVHRAVAFARKHHEGMNLVESSWTI
jgi:hypothetical protein